jgi:hypothetical protein
LPVEGYAIPLGLAAENFYTYFYEAGVSDPEFLKA